MIPRKTQYLVASGALVMAVAILALDYVSHIFVWFPVLFVLPVMLSSWYCSRFLGLALAVALPSLRLLFFYLTDEQVPLTFAESCVNAGLRVLVLSLIAVLTNRTRVQQEALERRVKVLEGFLPICSHCKKIRDTLGKWQQLESYIQNHSEAQFTHSICPVCCKQHYAEYFPEN